MSFIQGIAASNGIAIAKAYRLEEPDLTFEKKTIDDPASEVQRFHSSVKQANTELEAIRDRAKVELGDDKAAIFEAHLTCFKRSGINGNN